jgi:ribose transport system substrate-binding protein
MLRKLVLVGAIGALVAVTGCSAVSSGAGESSKSDPPAASPASNSSAEAPAQSSAASSDAGASSTGEATPSSGEKLEIAWLLSKATAQADQRALEGFQAYIKDNGLDWNVSVSDGKGSAATSADLIENAVQRGSDAIVLSMTDMRASQAALEHAKSAGIPVFTVDSGWAPGVVIDITSNNYVMGATVNSYLADRLGGSGGVVALKENGHHGVRKRGLEFDTVMSENPDIKILAEHNIDNSNFFADSQNAMEDFAQRFGDEIDAVFAGWDEPAMAAADVLQTAGIDAFVVGVDGNIEAIKKMRDASYPLAATVAQDFEGMGGFIAASIARIVIDKEDAATAFPVKTVYRDVCLITKQNLPAEGAPPASACS